MKGQYFTGTMNLRKLFFLFFLFAGIFSVTAQNNADQKITLDGKMYLLHQVQEGESIQSMAETYHVGTEEIVAANPDLLFGLKTGSEIKIPLTVEPDFINVKVKNKQTVFSIARQYRISLEELYRYNPEAQKGIEAEQILRIPVYKTVNPGTQVSEKVVQKHKADTVQQRTKHIQSAYFKHQLEPGETLFDLEKKYGVPQDTLLALNPLLRKEVVAGPEIRIPAGEIPSVLAKPENEKEFIRRHVQENENIYQLAARFNVGIDELRKVNPELQYRDPIAGEELLIPDKSLQKKVFDENIQDTIRTMPDFKVKYIYRKMHASCKAGEVNSGQTYRIALLLPLFLDANDTVNRIFVTGEALLNDSVFMSTYQKEGALPKDTFKIRREKIIDPRSENFMHLYEGVLMAADSLRKQGMNLELHVFDTNRDSLVIDSLLRQNVLQNMDLIIGPVYPDLQAGVSDFSAENHIPMVSPLSSGGDYEKTNPYYFKLNPTKDYLMKETAQMIAENYFDKNFIILQMSDYRHLPEAMLADQCREWLFSTGYYDQTDKVLFHEYDFETDGIWGLQRLLLPDRENVFIIPASNEGQISIAVTNLNTLAEQADIHLVGLSGFKSYHSIQTEYFHNIQLQYLTHYFIDYESVQVNRFIAAFKKQFATEPNEFSFQGFDLAYYFMSALHNFGKDFIPCIPGFSMKLNQLDLRFRRVSPDGGFMNYGLFNVCYEKNFDVKNKGCYSPNCLIPAGE